MDSLGFIVAGCLLVAATVLSWRSRYWGLVFLIVLLPFEKIGSIALGTNGPLIRPAQLAATGLIASIAIGYKRIPKTPYTLPALFFLGWALVPTAIIDHPQIWKNYIALVFCMFTLLAVAWVLYKADHERLTAWILGTAAVMALFGLYQFAGNLLGLPYAATGLMAGYSAPVLGYPRIQSTFLEPLYFANYLLLPLLLGLSLWISKSLNGWMRLCFGTVVLGFFLTTSRGALISAAIGFMLLAWLAKDKLKKIRWQNTLAALAITITVSIALLGVSSSRNRGAFWAGPKTYLGMLSGQFTKNASFQERATEQVKASQLIKRNFVFGVGPGQIRSPEVAPQTRLGYDNLKVNSFILELVAEFGVVGFGFFGWFLATIFYQASLGLSKATGNSRAWGIGLISAVLAILIQYQSLSGFFITHLWVSLGFLAGWGLKYAPSKQLMPKRL